MSTVNVEQALIEKREFGFFYSGKYYLESKEEADEVNHSFQLLYDNKKVYDMTASQKKTHLNIQQQKLAAQEKEIQAKVKATNLFKNPVPKDSKAPASKLSALGASNLKKQFGQKTTVKPQPIP